MTELELSNIMAECEKNAIPDSQIDLSEIPEEKDFSEYYFGNKKYFESKPTKTQVSIRLNTVLYNHLKANGKGWQSKINDYLMQSMLQGKI